MGTDIGLHEWSAEPGVRVGTLLGTFALVVATLAITPVAHSPLVVSFSLFGTLIGASIVGNLIVALLLIVQGRAFGSPAMTVLGTGFAFVSAIMVPYIMFFPGMFPPSRNLLGTHGAASGILWLAWHLAQLVAILIYVRMRQRARDDAIAHRVGRIVAWSFLVAFVAIVPAAIGLDLPPVYRDGHWTPLFLYAIPFVALPGLVAVVATLRRRNPTVLDLAVGIVAVALLLDLYLTAIGDQPFTVGWYASRLLMLLAMTAVLGILLAQTSRLYTELVRRAEVLDGEAHTDKLTELPNRRRFDEELGRASGSAMRRSSPLSVAMIDIDRFKRYNDTFGHQAGDVALHHIAQIIADSVERSNDFAARYGGEEFIVILEDTDLDGATAVAEKIRNAVLSAGIPAPKNGTLSVSIGVATRNAGETGEALVRRADKALYRAKNTGRDRVVAATDDDDATAREREMDRRRQSQGLRR